MRSHINRDLGTLWHTTHANALPLSFKMYSAEVGLHRRRGGGGSGTERKSGKDREAPWKAQSKRCVLCRDPGLPSLAAHYDRWNAKVLVARKPPA